MEGVGVLIQATERYGTGVGKAVVRDELTNTVRIDISPKRGMAHAVRARTARRHDVEKAPGRGGSAEAGAGISAVLGNHDFKGLFQSVYDAAVIADLRGNIVDANARASQFIGYSIEELRGLSVLQLISGAAEAGLIDTIRENLVDRFVLIEACYCIRKDGTVFPAEIAVNEIMLAGQDFLCFFVRDITWRKESQDKLLVISNAIANSYSGIAICNLDSVIEYVNPAVCRMWRYAGQTDLRSRTIRSLWKTTECDADLEQFIAGQERVWQREVTAVRQDGTEFELRAVAAHNTDGDGRKVGIVFSLEDISERKRAEQVFRETERQRVMLESLGTACHHLGQPATVLLANLGLMKEQFCNGDPAMNHIIETSLQAAERLSGILHKLSVMEQYRTTPYLEDESGGSSGRILAI